MENRDFLKELLEEIHEENLKKKKEAEELMKKLSEEGGQKGWIKFFEKLR